MKLTLHIIESLEKYNEVIHRKIERGTLRKPATGLVMTPETFAKVFSPERIKLLRGIYRNNITSIYQLAKCLGKPYEVVFRNIKYLEGMGLIRIVEQGHRKIPYLTGKVSVEMMGAA